MKKTLPIVTLIVLVLFQSSCGMKKIATRAIGGIAADGMSALEGEEDVSFARQSAPALIKTIEVLRHGDLKDARSLTILSQSYGQYAFGFLEEDMLSAKQTTPEFTRVRNEADLFYRRGREFGMAALISHLSMKDAFKSPFLEFKAALSRLSKKDVPALFWTAFNWACYLNLHLDDPAAIADLPRIQAMIDRVIELDTNYYYGSAHAFKGILAASRPKMLGGDPSEANREFKEAMRIAPDYLMTKVLYAQYYAKQMQDTALFRDQLNEVIRADVLKLPRQRLANELAKQRASFLLSNIKNSF